MSPPELATLIDDLGDTGSAVEATGCLLPHLEAFVREVELHPIQVSAHLRSADSYRALLLRSALDSPHATPSASAWRLLSKGASWACGDARHGTWWVGRASGETGETTEESAWDDGQSRADRTSRGVTHVLAFPLRVGRSEPSGHVAVELSDPAFAGRLPVSTEQIGDLRRAVSCAAAHLSLLPSGGDKDEVDEPDELLPVVGELLRSQLPLLRTFAGLPDTILITGPTGSGKSRLARWIHAHSARVEKSFELVDMNAVPRELQLAELFGWKQGAFTSAVRDQVGAIERVGGGTLFLDEIDKLGLEAQAGLLTLLDDGSYRRLGDRGPAQRASCRFIAGTSSDLRELVERGTFREDLYYRLSVLPVRLRGLDERRDEIGGWSRYLLGQLGEAPALASDAETLLAGRSWPGNLRQLDNVLRRAAAFATSEGCEGRVRLQDVRRALDLDVVQPTPELPEAARRFAGAFVEAIEEERLAWDDLEALKGVVVEAAIGRTDDLGEAMTLLGRGKLVADRNHQKAARRERGRWSEVLRKLGVEEG
ncbi:MAG: sigma 54-interacting transcriptional regulator [Acidobacteriota bacterium]